MHELRSSGQDENKQSNQAGASEFSSRQSTFSLPVWLSQVSARDSTAAGSAMDEAIFSSPFHLQASAKSNWPPFSLPVLSSRTPPPPAAPSHGYRAPASIFHAPVKVFHRTPAQMRQRSTHGSNACLTSLAHAPSVPDTSATDMPLAPQDSVCASAPAHSDGAAVATDEEGPARSVVHAYPDGLPVHGHERCTETGVKKRPRPLHLHGNDSDDVTLLQVTPPPPPPPHRPTSLPLNHHHLPPSSASIHIVEV